MTTEMPVRVVNSLWLTFWSSALAWSWLLPNHYPPWSTFHMDAWAALVNVPMAAAVMWRTRDDRRTSATAIGVLALAALPWIQFAFGQIAVIGAAWISFAYIVGLSAMIVVGQRWEAQTPSQPGNGLFLAIGTAAILSVGLQFHQWLRFDFIQIWAMGSGAGRPFANFGQPNLLGTFLLWGLLALGWGYIQGQIRSSIAIGAAVFVLFGLAMTASRTAWIGVVLVTLAAWYWRELWPSRFSALCVSLLALCFFVLVWSVPHIAARLLLSSADGDIEQLARMSGELRPRAWAIFLDAATHRPWFGYGWNQVGAAQLEVAADHPPLNILFTHTHNLFLDLVLFCGLPIGFILIGLLLFWVWTRFRGVRDASAALLFMLLLVIGNHAMLEFPLHHAYFLLPVGLVVGALDARIGAVMTSRVPRWLWAAILLATAALLAVLIRDYMRIESSYQALRFQWANIKIKDDSKEAPQVLVLNHLRDVIAIARFEPEPNMPVSQLNWMRNTGLLFPSAGVIHKLAVALAWNRHPEEAQLWLRRLCAVAPKQQCEAVQRSWQIQAQDDPLLAVVKWP